MTQKQILKKLIAHYTGVIRLCNKAKVNDSVWKIVQNTHTQFGLCSASLFVTGESIAVKDWLVKNCKTKDKKYWYTTPSEVNSKKSVIRCLQYRLDKMNEILSTLK